MKDISLTSYNIESYKYGSKQIKAKSACAKACYLMARENRVSYYDVKASIIKIEEIKQSNIKPVYDINDMRRHEFSMKTND